MKSAKRSAPEPEPVVLNGVRYEVDFGGPNHGIDQTGGVLAAVEEASGALKWRVVVYTVVRNPAKETDTQDVFITSMVPAPDGTALLVENEKGESFSVTLETGAVTPAPAQP